MGKKIIGLGVKEKERRSVLERIDHFVQSYFSEEDHEGYLM